MTVDNSNLRETMYCNKLSPIRIGKYDVTIQGKRFTDVHVTANIDDCGPLAS